jgi:CheY-like chemotaxis protein
MHGGTIEAQSAGLGQGSEFIVTLPAFDRAPAEIDADEAVDRVDAMRRILVVDDNRDSADSLGMLLKFLGAEVHLAYDGPTALDAIQRYRPSVILLDIGMPMMNGYEVARRVRALPQGKDMILVALTGWGQDEDRQRSQDAGFDHHLVKPIDIRALQAVLVSLE